MTTNKIIYEILKGFAYKEGKEYKTGIRDTDRFSGYVLKQTIEKAISKIDDEHKKEVEEVLSKRELEVLKMATGGLSNQDIADGLCLSLRTIQAHLRHIFNKLQVSSRTEAVVRALKEGWISLEDIP